MKINIKDILSMTLSMVSILGGALGIVFFGSQPTRNIETYGQILSWGWIVVGVLQLAIVGVEVATGLGRLLFFIVTVLLGCIPLTGLVAIALRLEDPWLIVAIGTCWSAVFAAYLLAFAGILKPRAIKC